MSEQKKYKIEYTVETTSNDESLIKELKKIPSNEVKILYETEFYDGPLEGLCSWRDEKYYFQEIKKKDETKNKRLFFLIKLLEEQLVNEELLHEEYKKYVESYPYVKEHALLSRKDAEWGKYHESCEKYPHQRILENQIIGWFELV